MAISSYAGLKTQVGSYLARDNAETDAALFISLFEDEFDRVLGGFVADTEVTASLTATADTVTLPADVLRIKSLRLTGRPYELEQMGEADVFSRYLAEQVGTPTVYARRGRGTLLLRPAPSTSTALTLVYNQALPRLSTSNTSNWLLARDSSAYLYGALAQAGLKYQDNEYLATLGGKWQSIASEWLRQDGRQRVKSGGLNMMPARNFGARA